MGTPTLFCLPFAGGDEFAYLRWPALLAGAATVHTLGRDVVPSVGKVADRVERAAVGPYAIYGHSMGARLGFEVVRELRRRGAPLPRRLYVGGAHPPDLREPIARVAHLDITGFLDQLVLRADTPAAVRDDPDVRAAVEPVLAADLAWLQAYRFQAARPLPVPIVAVAATADAEVPHEVMLGWARHTSARFAYHAIAAGHLFIGSHAPSVTALIAADLQGGETGAAPSDDHRYSLWRVDRVSDVDKAERLVRDRSPVAAGVFSAVSGDTALVAVGACVRGVAVERVRPIADLDAFCAGLDAHDRAAVLGEPEEDQVRAALLASTARRVSGPEVRRLDLGGVVAAVATTGGATLARYETV